MSCTYIRTDNTYNNILCDNSYRLLIMHYCACPKGGNYWVPCRRKHINQNPEILSLGSCPTNNATDQQRYRAIDPWCMGSSCTLGGQECPESTTEWLWNLHHEKPHGVPNDDVSKIAIINLGKKRDAFHTKHSLNFSSFFSDGKGVVLIKHHKSLPYKVLAHHWAWSEATQSCASPFYQSLPNNCLH